MNKFEQENERRPSVEEISESLDLPEDKIDEAMSVNTRHVSVDAPFIDGEDNSLLDVLINDDAPMADRTLLMESLKAEINNALKVLNERERGVIEAFYGINQPEMTLEEIGSKFGLTRERVRQIKNIFRIMKYLKFIALAIVLTAFLPADAAKKPETTKAYLFGFVANFTDSVVYFTDIQEVDKVTILKKSKFLKDRASYSDQLRYYFTNKLNMPHRTCIVSFGLTRKEAEKKYVKMRKIYTEKSGGRYDVRYITENDFKFQAILPDEIVETVESK